MNGKFAAGVAAIALAVVGVTMIVAGVGIVRLGIVPTPSEVGRLVAWMAVTMVNGALAQATALRAGRASRPAPDIAQTELPKALAAGLVVAGALALLGPGTLGAVGANKALSNYTQLGGVLTVFALP